MPTLPVKVRIDHRAHQARVQLSTPGLAKLEYRSIFFETEYLEPESGYFQPAWVVNHPASEFGNLEVTKIFQAKKKSIDRV